MDCYNDPKIREVVFIKPTQVGGTSAFENIMGYIIDMMPATTMAVFPNDTIRKTFSENKLQPMIEASPNLKEKFYSKKSKTSELRFTGMTLHLANARSISEISMMPIKNLFLDEIDKITFEHKGEGDVISLVEERTKTYKDRKIFKTSTPTTKNGRIWKEMQSSDVIKKPRVKCPECEQYIELNFKNLKWNTNEETNVLEDVWYVCNECGGVIPDSRQYALTKHVKWFDFEKNREKAEKVAFWMNTLYSPFVTWREIAEKWIQAQEDKSKLHNFINSWLAETWTEEEINVDEEIIRRSQSGVPRGIVPEWAELLTGGVDVQENSLYYQIKAWGPYLTAQVIDNGQVLDFTDIELVMNNYYKKESGQEYQVSLCGIDSGHRTSEVYEFCALNAPWAIPMKGSSNAMPDYYRISKTTVAGTPLVIVDTNKYKELVISRYQRTSKEGDPLFEMIKGGFTTYENVDEEYISQLTAEQKKVITEGARRGQTVWSLIGSRDNHYLDTDVYACAAADIMQVRMLHHYID